MSLVVTDLPMASLSNEAVDELQRLLEWGTYNSLMHVWEIIMDEADIHTACGNYIKADVVAVRADQIFNLAQERMEP